METTFNVTYLITILAVLVGIVNILTEVIKKLTWDKIPSSLLAFIISQVITLLALFIYMTIMQYTILWYYIVIAIIIGFFVAYAAMFGFDKLKDIISSWGVIKAKKLEDK